MCEPIEVFCVRDKIKALSILFIANDLENMGMKRDELNGIGLILQDIGDSLDKIAAEVWAES